MNMGNNVDEQVDFYKSFIENTLGVGEYKAGYNVIKNIKLDKDYSLIMKIIKELDPDSTYEDIGKIKMYMFGFCNSQWRKR